MYLEFNNIRFFFKIVISVLSLKFINNNCKEIITAKKKIINYNKF